MKKGGIVMGKLFSSSEPNERFFSGLVPAALFLFIFPIGGAILAGVMIAILTRRME